MHYFTEESAGDQHHHNFGEENYGGVIGGSGRRLLEE